MLLINKIRNESLTISMNQIQALRTEILQYFNPANEVVGSGKVFISPNQKYSAHTRAYKQEKPDCNWGVSKVAIFGN